MTKDVTPRALRRLDMTREQRQAIRRAIDAAVRQTGEVVASADGKQLMPVGTVIYPAEPEPVNRKQRRARDARRRKARRR